MVEFLSDEDLELCLSEDIFGTGWELWINRDPLGQPVSIFFKLNEDKVDEMDYQDFFIELTLENLLELGPIVQEHIDIYLKNVESGKAKEAMDGKGEEGEGGEKPAG